MASSRFGHWPLILGTVFALSACVEGGGRSDGPEPLPQSGNARMTDRDFEAPQSFQAAEKGLWDGRPSLGGVWVAHPDVGDPRRVLIRNTENGQEVIGALFRRERANPGPRIQISSDAAERLGILAGQPTDLRVVALERQEEEAPADTATEASTEAVAGAVAEETAPADGAAEPAPAADVAATAAAALDAAEGADPAALPAVEPQPVPEDRPPTSFGRRNRQPPPAPVPAPAAAPEADAATTPDAASDPATAVLPADAVPVLEPQPVPEDRPPTSFGRRNRQPAAVAAPAAAPAQDGEVTVAPLDGAAEPAAPAEAAAPAQGASRLREPFLQAVVLSSEEAAQQAAAEIGGAGLAVTVGEFSGESGALWRVLVGPAATRAERNAMLETLRSLGYADAYPVGG